MSIEDVRGLLPERSVLYLHPSATQKVVGAGNLWRVLGKGIARISCVVL